MVRNKKEHLETVNLETANLSRDRKATSSAIQHTVMCCDLPRPLQS